MIERKMDTLANPLSSTANKLCGNIIVLVLDEGGCVAYLMGKVINSTAFSWTCQPNRKDE